MFLAIAEHSAGKQPAWQRRQRARRGTCSDGEHPPAPIPVLHRPRCCSLHGEDRGQMLVNSDFPWSRHGGQGSPWPSHGGFAGGDVAHLRWRGSSGYWGGQGSAAQVFGEMQPLS